MQDKDSIETVKKNLVITKEQVTMQDIATYNPVIEPTPASENLPKEPIPPLENLPSDPIVKENALLIEDNKQD